MVTTEKVCKLIASLDANEKRYFKTMVGRQEKQPPQYMLLFDIITKNIDLDEDGEAYCTLDEEAIILRLRRKRVPESQFHVVRYHLAYALLKALRLMREENNIEDSIKNLLNYSKVLEYRGLSDWANEMAMEALKSARKFEYHGLAIEALQTLVYLRSQQTTHGYVETTIAYLEDLAEISRQLDHELQMFSLWHRAFMLYRTKKGAYTQTVEQEIELLRQYPALAASDQPVSFQARMHVLKMQAVLADLQWGDEAAHPWYAQIMALWKAEEYRHFQKERPRPFMIHLSNYLVFCIANRDFDAYEEHINALEQMEATNSDMEAELFQNLRFIQLLYFISTDKLESAKKLAPIIEAGIKKYAFKINKSRLFALRINMVIVFFALEEYDTALHHCAILKTYGKSEQRKDVQSFTQFLRHISHFELNEYDAMENFVRKHKSNLGKDSPPPRDFERITLVYLTQIFDAYLKGRPGPKLWEEKLLPLFAAFDQALERFKNDHPPVIPPGFDVIELWVKSKLEGRSFRDMLKG